MDTKTEVAEFLKWTNNLPQNAKVDLSKKDLDEAESDFKEFSEKIKCGTCSMCNKPIRHFNEDEPCLHWLLKPKSIKKTHIEQVLRYFGFYRSNTYLRWAANSEEKFKNINDLESIDPTKIIEESISWNTLRWSFSCSESDFIGHQKSLLGDKPHYHLAMWQDNLPFIKYNDFHIPFTKEDLFNFELQKNKTEDIKFYRPYASGMKHVFEWGELEENQDEFLKGSGNGQSEDNAALHFSTLVMASDGEKISGGDIYNLMEKAKNEGTTIAYQLKKSESLKNTNIRTIITPGDGVPTLDTRTKRKNNING